MYRGKLAYLLGAMLTFSIAAGCNQKKESGRNDFATFVSKDLMQEKIISSETYRIVKVSDGDTFWCEDMAGKRVKIRLIGIDAPEPRNYFKKKKQPFGKEASAYATKLLLNKTVKLELDITPLDQYGRTLAYAYLLDSTFINEKIVKDGYAVLMTIPPNVKYVDRLTAAQRHAQQRKLGLWNTTKK